MNMPIPMTLRAAFVAALMAAAPVAQSQMYRWIDAHGAVTYSNQLPSATSVVKDLTVVLDNPGGEIDSAKRGNNLRIEQSTIAPLSEPPQTSTSPRIAVSPTAPEAVRDPCL